METMWKVLEMLDTGKAESLGLLSTKHCTRLFPVGLGLLMMISATAWASEIPVAYPKKPISRPHTSHATTSIPDCSEAIPVSLVPNSSQVFVGDTTSESALIPSYSCQPWNESGPEVIYEVTTTEPLLLHAILSSPGIDLDIFLLSDCDTDACVAAHTAEFMAEIPAGTWYLIVDGFMGAAGAYDLTLNGLHSGLPQTACDSATPLVATGDVLAPGNILDQPNLVTMGSCGSFLEWGGEQWYQITVPAMTEATILLSGLSFDGAIWIFDDCGEQPACLGYADGGGLEQPEEIIYANTSSEPESIMLGIDSFREVSTANGNSSFDGAFMLTITSAVPAERTSTSGLKSMFR
jgi:hypothetical protein